MNTLEMDILDQDEVDFILGIEENEKIIKHNDKTHKVYNKQEVKMEHMNTIELDEFKSKIQKETIDSVLKTLKVSDSYFYAEMVIMKASMIEDPFQRKIKVIIKMNLYNSQEFQKETVINNFSKCLNGKYIETTVLLDSYDLIRSKEDAMLLIYKEVSAQIAADLFQRNSKEINMIVNDIKKYI